MTVNTPPVNTPPAGSAPSSGTPPAGGTAKTGKEPVTTKVDSTGKDQGADAGKPASKSGPPDVYKWNPSPDGAEVGEEAGKALAVVARELNLDNAGAQKIIDTVAPALLKQQEANIKATIAAWEAELQADPVIGGTKLQETRANMERALDLHPPMRELLNANGLGNHKVVAAFLAAVGKKVAPDGKVVAATDSPKPPPKTAEERLADLYR